LYCRDSAPNGDDDIDIKADKLGRDLRVALSAPFRPAILDRDRATLDPAEFAQAAHQGGGPWCKGRNVRAQKPNRWQPSCLLPVRRERPRRHRATGQRDELAPSHCFARALASLPDYSIGHATNGMGVRG